MNLSPGGRLGPYEIVGPLGAGGMGEVYRARDTRLERQVAIKLLPSHLAVDPDASARFERKARAIAAISHTNILAAHDFGTEGTDGLNAWVTSTRAARYAGKGREDGCRDEDRGCAESRQCALDHPTMFPGSA